MGHVYAVRAAAALAITTTTQPARLILCPSTHPPLPSTSRNALSLYVNITHILWDYDSEEKVAGYVSNATTERVIPFDIDATTTSEFDVAAQLWESVALASNVEAVVAC